MRVPILHSSLSIYCRILLTLACLAGPFATLLAGQTRDPVSEALSLMNKGQLDKALELLTLLEAADQEPKGAEYLLGAELNRPFGVALHSSGNLYIAILPTPTSK